ncbi:hypothetical protein L3Q82_001970 [Scortum barcoo]|uniref:Uncharacterized protein n=1 Tax=Scortum barcoo TaxID=214431 RepID=A0ACB8W1S2_9TELE|nr:hypothetical protein L3Q82_001970 [Scortum barcoo]
MSQVINTGCPSDVREDYSPKQSSAIDDGRKVCQQLEMIWECEQSTGDAVNVGVPKHPDPAPLRRPQRSCPRARCHQTVTVTSESRWVSQDRWEIPSKTFVCVQPSTVCPHDGQSLHIAARSFAEPHELSA